MRKNYFIGLINIFKVVFFGFTSFVMSVMPEEDKGGPDGKKIEVTVDASKALQEIEEAKNKPHNNVDVNAVTEKARKDESNRIREIQAIAEKHGLGDLSKEYVDSGRGVDEFRMAALEKIGKAEPVTLAPEIGMSNEEVKNYSFVRAINAAVTGDWSKAGLEKRASEGMAQRLGKTPQGFFVPTDVLQRDLVTSSAAAGGDLVATNLLAGSFIDMLRNRMMVKQLGATILTGLTGDVAIPTQDGAATAYWVAEDTNITESALTVDQVEMSPETLGAWTNISRRLLNQSSPDIEALVRNDLQTVLALAIDLAAINGSGSSNQPTGILSTSGIGAVAGGTNGLAPAWSHIVDLETEVSTDNADVGKLAYLSNAKVRGVLKGVYTNATYGEIPVWQGSGENQTLNGYNAGVSNQVPSNLTKGSASGVCSAIIFGNWADLLIGFWSGLDLIVDPYTYSSKGSVKLVALQDVDVAVRHAESFAAMQDALTA